HSLERRARFARSAVGVEQASKQRVRSMGLFLAHVCQAPCAPGPTLRVSYRAAHRHAKEPWRNTGPAPACSLLLLCGGAQTHDGPLSAFTKRKAGIDHHSMRIAPLLPPAVLALAALPVRSRGVSGV